MNRLEQDFKEFNNCQFIDWDKIDHHTFLITGATGVLGALMVKGLRKRNKNIRFVLPVRSIEKAKGIFGECDDIEYIQTNIEDFTYDKEVDYIIHAASPTKSKFFIEYPVETMKTAIDGTKAILEYAKNKNVKSVVYVSSMEMYGTLEGKQIKEEDLGYIDPHDIRSSYSEGKRVAELYCCSYLSEYKVPVKIARLAMTFGAGLPKNENRVYKYFCECILNKQDIVLKSTGETVINYSYTTDALLGLLKILTDGNNGDAYNISSDPTHMTIKDSAEWLVKEYGEGQCQVIIDIPEGKSEFAPVNHMVLDNSKLKSIGWSPKVDLKTGYKYLMEDLKG